MAKPFPYPHASTARSVVRPFYNDYGHGYNSAKCGGRIRACAGRDERAGYNRAIGDKIAHYERLMAERTGLTGLPKAERTKRVRKLAIHYMVSRRGVDREKARSIISDDPLLYCRYLTEMFKGMGA